MFKTSGTVSSILGAYHMRDVAMRYSRFVPRLYNLAKSLGFESGKIMPSRAFCSDESQGYPIILLTQHFGTFPFNHGLVGGVVATDRHGPHAHHGKDLIIIQASHVGFDPDSQRFGVYRRLQTHNASETTSCGKICGVLDWFLHNYKFAKENIFLVKDSGQIKIIVDNSLLHMERRNGLILRLNQLVNVDSAGAPISEGSLSTAKVFTASAHLTPYLNDFPWESEPRPIGDHLHPDLFYFNRTIDNHEEGRDHLENNLLEVMPYVVSSKWPALTAAQANTQVEFDRAFRTIIQEPAYENKKLLFVSGLNVDLSPREGQIFPTTKFIPWAACIKDEHGNHHNWEQNKLYERLLEQSIENPDKIDLEDAIEMMENAQETTLPF